MEPIESIFSEPQELLLEYVRSNDRVKISELVESHPELINQEYYYSFDSKTIIEIACSTFSAEIEPETVDTLLDLGADLFSTYYRKQAIHYAAISCNGWLLEKICCELEQGGIDDNLTEGRDTPLLCVIKECDCESKSALECIEFLLDHDADANMADGEGISPILHAANKAYRNVIALLLERSNIDIDTHTFNNQTARYLIIRHNLYDREKLPPKENILSSLRNKKFQFSRKRHEEDILEFENGGSRRKLNAILEMEQTNTMSTPEERLLRLVRNNNISEIQRLVERNREILEYEYEKPFYGKTIIQIVCSTFSAEVTKDTVLKLIELEADLSKPSRKQNGKRAIHFAATSLIEWLLSTICENLTREDIDSTTDNGDTALMSIIRECDCESKNALQCIGVLLRHNTNVNKADCYNESPILLACKYFYRKVIDLLLQCPNIDLNTHTYGSRTTGDYISDFNLCDMKKLPPGTIIPSKKRNLLKEKFQSLYDRREEVFLKFELIREDVCETNNWETMLQICARLNLPLCARRIVELGAPINDYTAKCQRTPLEIAAEEGHYEVFKEMCGNLEKIPTFLLRPSIVKINFKKCLEIMLRKNKSLASRKIEGETLLSYAILFADKEVVLMLLNNGASLGDADLGGSLPINDIEIETLRKHFDNCINFSSPKIGNCDLLVTFNYKTLLPTKFCTERVNATCEEEDAAANLELLGRNIRESDSEMSVISHIAQNKRLQPLLTHPIITSFIQLKWHRMRYFFYTNLVMYLVTWISLIIYTSMVYNYPDSGEQPTGIKITKHILLVIIWTTFVLFIAKELFQLIVSPILYIKQIENLFENVFIITMSLVLLLPEPSDSTRKQIFSFATLVSAFQLVLLLGQLPIMSTNIIMLRTVSYTFFKLLFGNIILILAFAFSFYMLFSDTTKSDEKLSVNSTASNEENNAFNGIGVSFFKTFVMMTGEFEVGNINFNAVPVMSRIIFILFIFMVVIVLFNLMNGLAVSDTQEIRSNAKLYACKSRVDHICYIKNMLLGNLADMPLVPKILSDLAYLFPKYLNCFEMNAYINKKGKIELPRSEEDVQLDKETLKNVRLLLKERNNIEKTEESLQNKLEIVDESIQRKLVTVEDSLQKLQTVVDTLQKKLDIVNDQLQKKIGTENDQMQKLVAVVNSLQRRFGVIEDQHKSTLENINENMNKILERLS